MWPALKVLRPRHGWFEEMPRHSMGAWDWETPIGVAGAPRRNQCVLAKGKMQSTPMPEGTSPGSLAFHSMETKMTLEIPDPVVVHWDHCLDWVADGGVGMTYQVIAHLDRRLSWHGFYPA